MPKKKKAPSRIKPKKKSLSKFVRREYSLPLEEEELPIKLRQTRALSRLEKDVVNQEKVSDVKFEEDERDVFEDPREKKEGLEIEEEEEAGVYPYPEIEVAEKKDADEDEEED